MITSKIQNRILDRIETYIEATPEKEVKFGLEKAQQIISDCESLQTIGFDDWIEMLNTSVETRPECCKEVYEDLRDYLLKMNVKLNKLIRKENKRSKKNENI